MKKQVEEKVAAPTKKKSLNKVFTESLFKKIPTPALTTPRAVLLGSIIIALAILTSGGIIRIKGVNSVLGVSTESTKSATNPSSSPQPSTPPIVANATLGRYPIEGNNNARVTVIEFADLRCPFCDQFFKNTQPQLKKDYIDTGKIRFAFRDYEFLGAASVTAGNAAACANEQNAFWKYHDYLYQNQPDESDTSMFNTDKLTSIAQGLGLNADQFRSCLSSTKYAGGVNGDYADGQKAGVTGTPTFLIGRSTPQGVENAQMIVGAQPYSVFQSAINALLQ